MNNKRIIAGISSIVAGAVGIFFIKKYKKNNPEVKEATIKEDFKAKKERIMKMLEESRKKFNEKHNPPVKNSSKKSEMHNYNSVRHTKVHY